MPATFAERGSVRPWSQAADRLLVADATGRSAVIEFVNELTALMRSIRASGAGYMSLLDLRARSMRLYLRLYGGIDSHLAQEGRADGLFLSPTAASGTRLDL